MDDIKLLHKITPGIRLKVAAYARISNDKEELETSLDEQIKHYADFIIANPNWEFIGIYYDDGISGTTISKRHGFNKMLELARNKMIDVILVKSVSRFSRNVVNLLEIVQELRKIGVEMFFEQQNVSSINLASDQMITIYAEFAEAEAVSTSNNVKWRVDKNMREGRYYIPVNQMLGYYYDEDGKLQIKEGEAYIIKTIYRLYLSGLGCAKIANYLKERKIPNKHGYNWSPNGIRGILRNEKYVGDCLLQKTYIEDPLTHKSIRNLGEKDQYLIENGHPAIIDRDSWNEVQEMIDEGAIKYKVRRKTANDGNPTNILSAYANWVICPYCGSNFHHKINHYNGKPANRFLICASNMADKICEADNYPVDQLNAILAKITGQLKANKTDLKDFLLSKFTSTSQEKMETLNLRIEDTEKQYRKLYKSDDVLEFNMAFQYKEQLKSLLKEKNKVLHQLVELQEPEKIIDDILIKLDFLPTDPKAIEHSNFKDIFKHCVITDKGFIYFVIGNEVMTNVPKKPMLYFEGTHSYFVRHTEYKTKYVIYINK